MIFRFKISEYHWEAELMFNIKRINARVIQLAPDLCSYTSSDLEVSCNEVRLQAQASPDIFPVCGRSHVTVRSSGAALTSHCSSTCSTAALHRCSRPQDSEDLSRFPLSSIFSKPRNSLHWYCTLSIEFIVQDWVPILIILAPMVRTNYSAVKLYQNSAWQQSSCQESDFI